MEKSQIDQNNLDNENEEDEENLHSIGFMFDAYHEKIISSVEIDSNRCIQLKTIGDQPGHKQSGQYLWPAAKALSIYLSRNWNDIGSPYLIELGAGCGLAGLTSSFLPNVEEVIFTDYDYGTLTLIEDSIKLNKPPCQTSTFFLEWGKSNEIFERFRGNLIIGSDLIYSKDVVKPLFSTVKLAFSKNRSDGLFILATSFSLGEDIEALIESTCFDLNLSRKLIYSLQDNEYKCKIEYYQLRQ